MTTSDISAANETITIGKDEYAALREVWRAARLLAGTSGALADLRGPDNWNREQVLRMHAALNALAPIDEQIALGTRENR